MRSIDSETSGPVATEPSASERLDSWKEIAAYLKRDARTVRRWEKSEGLPVRRHVHRKKPTVYAYKDEVDAWWNNRRPNGASAATRPVSSRSWRLAGAVVLVVAGAVLGARLWSLGRSPDFRVPRLTNPVQVTFAVGVENNPTWSPDGTRVAYESYHSGNHDISVSEIVGGSAVNFTEDFEGVDLGPSWSPDGSEIAFVSERDGGGCFVVSALGGEPRRIVSPPNRGGGRPAWSPDGSKLACPGLDEERRPVIDVVTLKTGEVARLPLPTQYWTTGLSWSPDGRFFAYIDAINRGTADTTQLWITSLSGRSFALTDGKTEAWSPAWSRDGKSLLFVTNRGGSKDLWTQALHEDGTPRGDPERVTTGLGIQSVSFVADGSRIAYSKGGRFANVWRVPVFPDRVATWSDAERLTFDQAYIEHLDLSPDGRRLVVNSNRGGFLDLWTLPAEGGEMEPLTNDQAPDWGPSWSRDGRQIAFYSLRTGNRDIFVMPSDGGELRQLTTYPGGDFGPTWSPDGQRIVYTSSRKGKFSVFVVSAAGGDSIRLTDDGGGGADPAWSPDGRWIAFGSDRAGDGKVHIWRVGPNGSELERLTKRTGSLPRWSPDGERLFFRGRPERNQFWELALADRNERLVADLTGTPGVTGAHALATDGEYLYFTWEESLGDIWVMDVVQNESE